MSSPKTKFRILALDHDDTTVNSTPEINYPAYLETMEILRPGQPKFDYETFLDLCFDPGFGALCTDILKLNAEEMDFELKNWLKYVMAVVPSPVEGMDRIIRRQREAGGLICVVSHSMDENILRDWHAHFGCEPDYIYAWNLGEGKRKPDPFPVCDIMERYGVTADEILVIDDLKPGYEMARRAGVKFAGAVWGQHTPKITEFMKEYADVWFEKAADLERYLFDD